MTLEVLERLADDLVASRALSRPGSILPLLVLAGAALLEVAGDAAIRQGLRGPGLARDPRSAA